MRSAHVSDHRGSGSAFPQQRKGSRSTWSWCHQGGLRELSWVDNSQGLNGTFTRTTMCLPLYNATRQYNCIIDYCRLFAVFAQGHLQGVSSRPIRTCVQFLFSVPSFELSHCPCLQASRCTKHVKHMQWRSWSTILGRRPSGWNVTCPALRTSSDWRSSVKPADLSMTSVWPVFWTNTTRFSEHLILFSKFAIPRHTVHGRIVVQSVGFVSFLGLCS